MSIRLLSNHLALALAGGVATSILGRQARPLRNLLFRLMDASVPDEIQEVCVCLFFPHICCCDGLLWPAFFNDQCVHFVGCHRDSVRGSDDAATSSERENGATALAPSSRTRPLGEPLQRTGTSLCLLVKNRQFKLTYKSICQSYVCVSFTENAAGHNPH